MASAEECRTALEELAAQLARVDPALRRRHATNRTLSLRLPDLQIIFSGSLRDGRLQDVHETNDGSAQIRLTANSDDLLAVVRGSLPISSAVASGRLKVEASVLDLLKLRTFL